MTTNATLNRIQKVYGATVTNYRPEYFDGRKFQLSFPTPESYVRCKYELKESGELNVTSYDSIHCTLIVRL